MASHAQTRIPADVQVNVQQPQVVSAKGGVSSAQILATPMQLRHTVLVLHQPALCPAC